MRKQTKQDIIWGMLLIITISAIWYSNGFAVMLICLTCAILGVFIKSIIMEDE